MHSHFALSLGETGKSLWASFVHGRLETPHDPERRANADNSGRHLIRKLGAQTRDETYAKCGCASTPCCHNGTRYG
jgi:hypothetical protein